jgi:hypothetical protein
MGIQVTPIPRLTVLTAPAFQLGTANTAGAAITAVASNSTLLVYDTTVPTTIAASGDTAATGSAVVSARRDHQHGSSAFTTDISVKVHNDATQAITDDNTTTLTFNTEDFKTVTGMHDNSTNNSRLIATTDGKYLVVGQIEWSDSTSGSRWLQIINQDGATQATVGGPTVNATSVAMGQVISALIDMDADDYVYMNTRQNSGGSLNTETPRTMFSMMKIASP